VQIKRQAGLGTRLDRRRQAPINDVLQARQIHSTVKSVVRRQQVLKRPAVFIGGIVIARCAAHNEGQPGLVRTGGPCVTALRDNAQAF